VRHDWLWPLDRAGLLQRIADLSSGWFSEGFGHPNAYPMTYPVMWALTPVVLLFGSEAALVTLALFVGCCAAAASERVAARFGAGRVAAWALTLILLFNPWTYGKLVAGHLTQIAACFGFAATLAELTEAYPRGRRLALALALTALQLQFFLIAAALGLARSAEPAVRRALGAGLVVFSPTLLGIVLDRSSLLGLPLTLPWEDQQSVPLAKGWLLGGYFTGYADRAFDGPAGWAVGLVVVLAVSALVLVRTRASLAVATLAGAALLFASGTSGWLAGPWRWAILGLPEAGVFRELYDLIGAVACAYAVLCAALIGRFPPVRWVALACGVALGWAWFVVPPASLWVGEQRIPRPGPELARAGRYALMPPFQPLTYDGAGSGADPLYVSLAPDETPANDMLATFPAVRALGRYWTRGDAGPLARLGVGVIECRAGFAPSGAGFIGGAPASRGAGVCRNPETLLNAAPLVALAPEVQTCSLCAQAGNGAVFFGDLAPGLFRALPLQREFVDPARGWIDARLAFGERPDLAQGLGGIFTTSSRPFILPPGSSMLVAVRGALVDQAGRTLARDTAGYRWVRLPDGVRTVACRGGCTVAGVGSPGTVPLERDAARYDPIPSRLLASWLIAVDLPRGRSGLLRSLTSYDPGWVAFGRDAASALHHVRVDAAFNGWIVTAGPGGRVWLVHLPSVAQALASALGLGTIVVLLWLVARDAGVNRRAGTR
jgi:hypothetical protein